MFSLAVTWDKIKFYVRRFVHRDREVERVRAEWYQNYSMLLSRFQIVAADRDRLRAECDRLRLALAVARLQPKIK